MSLTGATAWPGDPPSSLLAEPSSIASTPRIMKTTTKIFQTRRETETSVPPSVLSVMGPFCLLHSAQPQKNRKNKCLLLV